MLKSQSALVHHRSLVDAMSTFSLDNLIRHDGTFFYNEVTDDASFTEASDLLPVTEGYFGLP